MTTIDKSLILGYSNHRLILASRGASVVVKGSNEQSEHWKDRQSLRLLQDAGFHDCWPCQEGFPVYPWHNRGGSDAFFEVVTAWGLRTEAWIDDTRQYQAEGLEWTILEDGRKRTIPAIQVACWRRIPGRSTPQA